MIEAGLGAPDAIRTSDSSPAAAMSSMEGEIDSAELGFSAGRLDSRCSGRNLSVAGHDGDCAELQPLQGAGADHKPIGHPVAGARPSGRLGASVPQRRHFTPNYSGYQLQPFPLGLGLHQLLRGGIQRRARGLGKKLARANAAAGVL
jgi:hypothetical protein